MSLQMRKQLLRLRFLLVVFVVCLTVSLLATQGAQSEDELSSPLLRTFNSPLPPQVPSSGAYVPYTRHTEPMPVQRITSWLPSKLTPNPGTADVSAHRAFLPYVARAWEWTQPGFGGGPSSALIAGIENYRFYGWNAACDYPADHQVPMIWGATQFYSETENLDALFNGPCNDGRALLFLNEPAMTSQANLTPSQAADMFYTMTRGSGWNRARWKGPIYVGNNLIEQQWWDGDFVRTFAQRYNGGDPRIREIAGWGVHLYGNFEYGRPGEFYNDDIPLSEIPHVVDASVQQLTNYIAARSAENNSTSIVVSEFGFLHDRQQYSTQMPSYTTTATFMEEYVRHFDGVPEIYSWLWFVSNDASPRFDVDFLCTSDGSLTPNGNKWRELASSHQIAGWKGW